MPKVSVIVPIYGVEEYIERCAISLFEQTLHDIEYIFVNDCTKDKSIAVLNDVISRYPSRNPYIKIISHEINKGLSAARNTGLYHSSGEYIMHVDSDDYVEHDLVESCVNKQYETGADIVFVDRDFIYADLIKTNYLKSCDDITEWRIQLLSGAFPHTVWGCLINKKLYTQNEILAIEGLHQGEDFAVMGRLAYHVKKVAIISRTLYHYLIRTDIYKYNPQIVKDTYYSWSVVENYYKLQKDYELYEDVLRKRLLSFYSWQIMCWARTAVNDISAAELIQKTFPPIGSLSEIPIRKRIVLFLFKYKAYPLLNIYTKIARVAQRILKRRGSEL